MGKIYRVNSFEEALELAKKFKASGKYDLFRGQAQNWKVSPSSSRLTKIDYNEGIEKLKRLYNFFETSENIVKYKSNIDWFFAVAQHYGLPTNYIDFSTSCEVAGFFATNSKSAKIGNESIIICLNEKDFNSFIKFTKSIYEKDKVIAPYIARVNVDNLWRLQSQEGLFLFTPYRNIEMYYDFDRIIFPYKKPYNGIKKNIIYPENKSELEIYLDYYFNNEERIISQKRFRKFTEELKIPLAIIPKINISDFLRVNQNHTSWASEEFLKWKHSFLEDWNTLEYKWNILLKLPINSNSYQTFVAETKRELTEKFNKNEIKRNNQLKFIMDLNGNNKSFGKVSKRIEKSCTRIWDGTRNLPFTDEEIYAIISDYIFFEYYEYIFEKAFSISNEKLIELELTNQYYSVTRCYVTISKIEKAFRDDIEEILVQEFIGKISSKILLNVNKPKIIFDFNKLLDLFKQEMIAYQVTYNSEKNNPVIFYSPTELLVLGYA